MKAPMKGPIGRVMPATTAMIQDIDTGSDADRTAKSAGSSRLAGSPSPAMKDATA